MDWRTLERAVARAGIRAACNCTAWDQSHAPHCPQLVANFH
jgi:hypothetical protein